ncbi:Transcriptional regulator, MerR family [hydrothermal vent metagenome]|uniref:Transcriptional regulator, MerR family n=1 Tax=hydrothermal vent metagenome TaxID=652676 RepID=A0A3B1C0U0_9ZZZZ
MDNSRYKISAVSKRLSLTQDTLRYYEKIGLLNKIERNTSGVRQYTEQDISHLRFIQRAQKMNFSLAEISELLKMRQAPQHAKDEVRQLTAVKLEEVETRLEELLSLKNELQLLLNLCRGTEEGCPIIENIENAEMV